MTGHAGEDFLGSKHSGYEIKGKPISGKPNFAIEGDSEEERICRQKLRIEKAIEEKLKQSWSGYNNWLCVLIDDLTWFSPNAWQMLSLSLTVFLGRI